MDAQGPALLAPRIAERLREAGLRVTQPRLRVYDVLRTLGGHRSADEVGAALAAAGRRLPRMSVYNAMRDLQRASLVMQADVGPGRTLYEAAEAWHHHFVCRACARIIDIPCVKGDKPCLDAAIPGVLLDEAQVIFRGLCEACATR